MRWGSNYFGRAANYFLPGPFLLWFLLWEIRFRLVLRGRLFLPLGLLLGHPIVARPPLALIILLIRLCLRSGLLLLGILLFTPS